MLRRVLEADLVKEILDEEAYVTMRYPIGRLYSLNTARETKYDETNCCESSMEICVESQQ